MATIPASLEIDLVSGGAITGESDGVLSTSVFVELLAGATIAGEGALEGSIETDLTLGSYAQPVYTGLGSLTTAMTLTATVAYAPDLSDNEPVPIGIQLFAVGVLIPPTLDY